MSEAMEKALHEIAQLREAVQSANSDRATLDYDALAAAVVKHQQALIDATTPARKGEISIGNGRHEPQFVKGGKFDGVKAEDVLFTDYLLRRAQEANVGNVKPASKQLRDAVEKALTATGSGTGDEYVPTGMAAELWSDMFLEARVAGQFDQINMPTDPWDAPLGWGAITWRKGTQNTATTASDPGTAKSTMTSTEVLAEVNWAYDLDEDSIIAILPTLRTEITRSGADAIDAFVMNADATNAATGNINLDDADPDDASYFLTNGQDGLRHLALVDNTGQTSSVGAALDDAKLRAVISKLGKYATQPEALRLFADPQTYVSMLGLTNVVTADKFGPQATVLTGVLARYAGIPVIPTSSVPLTEADGKVSTTGGNNTKGQLLIAHRDMWKVGFKRNFTIEVDRLIQKRQMVLVASFRIAVAARGARASATHTAVGVSITV